jgi:hypothetical protein
VDVPNLPVDVYQDAETHELYPVEKFPNWNAAFEPPYNKDFDDPANDPEYNRAKRAGLAR